MLKLIRNLFGLLTPSQVRRFYILQFLVVVMAFSEIVGVASIVPFMTLVGDMNVISENPLIYNIYIYSGVESPSKFVFLMGGGVLIMLFISAMISMFTSWQLSMFATKVGSEISDRLYMYYLKRDWLFHAAGSSAQLTKKISNEATRVTSTILLPLMQMNARIVLVLFMGVSIFLYDPKVAILGVALFSVVYFLLYKLVRGVLLRNGRYISSILEQRFRLMNEGFGGIRDILLLGRDDDFIARFKATGGILARSQGVNVALAQVPRYLIELVAYGVMIALVLYLIATHNGNLSVVLPIMSVFVLAGFRLLPAFQQIYSSVAQIKGNVAAFESIREDLVESQKMKYDGVSDNRHSTLSPQIEIVLKDICFTYPGKLAPAINHLTLSIKAKSVVGIVGPSGAGKSTLIDILLGLIQPQSGVLQVDNKDVLSNGLRAWQNAIGFVPQSIFLSEGTIAENIAFGISKKHINFDQVQRALKLAHLDDFVQSLDQGIHTKVGERGVQLSGGQRQRIGIARALYHEAEVLIFDEATSALDGITERLIMEAIHDFGGKKTIIMIAHRLKTVQDCDQIFFVDQGTVVDQGTYQQLIESNVHFKNMTNHA